MVQRFNTGLPSRSIPAGSAQAGLGLYIGLLVVAKFLKAVGLYMTYDMLKILPVIVFLFVLKAGTSVPLVLLQKPFSNGPKLSKNQWFRVCRHAAFGSGISFLWLFSLTMCGPLRSIILYENSEVVVLAGAAAIFSSGGPAKARAALIFLTGVLSLLLFDHDEKLTTLTSEPSSSGERQHTIFHHIFKNGVDFLGWSDHKGGVLLMFLTLCLNTGYNSAAKKLSIDVGGAKRLHSLSTLVQAFLFWPWATFLLLTTQIDLDSWLSVVVPLTLVVLFVGVVDFYVDSLAMAHLTPARAAILAPAAIFSSAIFLSAAWSHPYVVKATSLHKLNDIVTEDHVLSGGVVFTVGAFLVATRMLMARDRTAKGSFIGYNPAGLPLYSMSSEALHKTSASVLSVVRNGLRQILEDGDSRRIFYFLCVNLGFTFVELLYGVWTNSLGLISDGFHMFFDCSALVMGLYAAIMVRWKATRIFSYGFDRVEVLSGFINGLFLVVIALFVFSEAVARLFEPPEVKTEKLLTVSILGLVVNLLGIFAFQGHGHSHGGHGHSHGGHGHSHGGHSHGGHGHSHGGHGHSHGGHSHGGHGHSHGGHGHSHGGQSSSETSPSSSQGHHNTNMEGVFLHVLADTLGSVGVIISTLLIENFGWNIADPICSLFIAIMIFLSVLPLLRETSTILMLRSPHGMEDLLATALEKTLALDGVLSYREPHFWRHTASKVHGMIHVQVAAQTPEQRIIPLVVSAFKDAGVSSLTVQVEKQSYFFHLSGLGAASINMSQFSQQHNTFRQRDTSNVSVKAV